MPIDPLQEPDPQTFAIIGAAMEVHGRLGCGYLEAVYRVAFRPELTVCHIPFHAEVELEISRKGTTLPSTYRVDAICYGLVIVELKALSKLTTLEEAQG